MVKEYKTFKYKGRRFYLCDTIFSSTVPGIRIKEPGYFIIMMNESLTERIRDLELHRLITGRGLIIKTQSGRRRMIA